MPDLKISQLPVATTPLAGTELVPIVQGGITDQTTVEGILTGTVPSGTASGVLYLNGSKVVTSGTGLVFDGSNLQINRSGAVTHRLTAVQALGGTNAALWLTDNSTTSIFMNNVSNGVSGIWSSGQLAFGISANFFSEAMRLNSTGLGIGTNNPQVKLDVFGAGTTQIRVTGVAVDTRLLSDSGIGVVGTYSSNPFLIRTNAATVATFDTAGNLGLGVTPSAWVGGFKVFAIGGNNVWSTNDSNTLYLTQNSYFDGAFKYQGSGYAATRHEMANGTFKWFTAPSGTAGNTISFTQAMTLDASGNLGIGLTNQTFRLEVSNASAPPARFNRNQAGSAIGALIFNQPNTTDGNSLTLRYTSDTTGAGAATDVPFAEIEFAADIHNQATRAGSIRFLTSLGGAGNSLERMRLDASGNLGLGVTPSAWSVGKAIEVGAIGTAIWSNSSVDSYYTQGAYFNSGWKYSHTGATGVSNYQQSQGVHRWSTAAGGTAGNAITFTQAMTLDASGQLGIGTTLPSALLEVYKSANNLIRIGSASTSIAGISIAANGNTHGSTSAEIMQDSSSRLNITQLASQPIRFLTNNTIRASVPAAGGMVVGTAALATNATDGFLYVPTCAGTPTGTPTAQTGTAPIVVDTTNNKLYFYSGGAWRDAGP